MREIILRGKRTDNGEWVCGTVEFHLVDGDLTHTKQDAFITYDSMDRIGKVYRDRYEVDINTIGQYTGLNDKNSVKIFEGDIVKFVNYIDDICSEEVGICVFEQDESNFVLQRTVKNPENYYVPTTTHTVYLISNRTYKDDVYYEVIGNIYDNPDMTKH